MGQAYDTQICEMSLPAFKAAWVGLQSATNDDPLYLCTVDVFSEEVLRTVENLNLILRLFPEQQKQSVESVRDFLKKIETVCEVLPSSLPELEALKESFRGPVEAAAALSQWPMNQTSQPISPETLAEIDLHYAFFKEVVVSLQSDELIVNANVDCNSMFQERFEAHWNSMKDANANGLRKLNFERETNFPSSKLRKRPSFSIDFGNGHTIAIELKFFEKGHTANEINCSRGQIASYAMESEVISTWGLICVNASLREKTESRFVEFFSNSCLSEALLERIKLPFEYCLIDDDEDDDEEVEKEMGAEFTEAEPNGVHGIYDSMAVTTFEDLDLDGEWDLHIEDEVRPGTRDFQHFKNEPTGRAYLKKMLLFLREDPQSSGKPRVIFAGGPTQVGKTQFKNITIDAVHKVANDKRLSCLAATVVATDSVSGALGLIDKMAFHLDGTSVMKPQVFDQALTFDLMYPFKHFCLTSSGEEETRYEMLDLKNSDLLLKSRRRKNCLERGGCVVMSGRQTSQIQHVVDDIAALDDDRKIVLIIDEADYLLSKKHHLDPTAPAYLRHLTRLVLGEDSKVKPHIVVLITATPLALRANEYLSEQLSLDEKEVCPCFWADASDVSTSRYIGAETNHELAVIQLDNGARKILQSDITFSRPEKGGTLTLPPGQKAFFSAAFKDEHAMVLDASVRFIFANDNCMFRKAALVQDKCAASAEHQIAVILYVGFGIFWSVEKGTWNGTRAEHGLPPHLKAHMLQLQVSYTHRKDVNPSIQEVLALPDINQCPVAIFGKTLMTRGISFRPKRGTHPASTQDRVPTHMLVNVGALKPSLSAYENGQSVQTIGRATFMNPPPWWRANQKVQMFATTDAFQLSGKYYCTVRGDEEVEDSGADVASAAKLAILGGTADDPVYFAYHKDSQTAPIIIREFVYENLHKLGDYWSVKNMSVTEIKVSGHDISGSRNKAKTFMNEVLGKHARCLWVDNIKVGVGATHDKSVTLKHWIIDRYNLLYAAKSPNSKKTYVEGDQNAASTVTSKTGDRLPSIAEARGGSGNWDGGGPLPHVGAKRGREELDATAWDAARDNSDSDSDSGNGKPF